MNEEQMKQLEALDAMPDDQIDTSDIPVWITVVNRGQNTGELISDTVIRLQAEKNGSA